MYPPYESLRLIIKFLILFAALSVFAFIIFLFLSCLDLVIIGKYKSGAKTPLAYR
jgi:hypothetical protein